MFTSFHHIPKTLISRTPNTSDVDDAVFYFHRMIVQRPPPPRFQVNQLLSFILKSTKDYGYVVSLYMKMERRKIVDIVSLNILLYFMVI
jgi:hypothetical protein